MSKFISRRLRTVCIVTSLFIAVILNATGSVAKPKSALPRQPFIIETSADGCIQVEQQEIKGHQYETLVVKAEGQVYRIPDERVYDYDQNGDRFVYNEDASEGRCNHEFFLSPKGDWLFITRKLFHPVNVGYLYHLRGAQFVPIRPYGLRFDNAAIGFFSRHLYFPYPTIGAGARVIRFEGWTKNRLIFSFGACQSSDRRGRTYVVVGYYDLKSGHFGLVSHSVESNP